MEVVAVWAQVASTIFMLFRLLASRRGAARLCDMFADITLQFDDGETVVQKGVTQVGFDEVQKTVTLVTAKATTQANLRRVVSVAMSNISGVKAEAPKEARTDG